MITIPTVLILGAGASEPYGFPTARKLLEQICDMLGASKCRSPSFSAVLGATRKTSGALVAFRDALFSSGFQSIDAWLEKAENEDVRDIGKAAIAARISRLEITKRLLEPPKPASEEDWYQVLWKNLYEDAEFETFQDNKLSVVTFNYDRSLEQYLFTRMKNTFRGKPYTEYAEKLHESIPVVHVYGSLGCLPWENKEWKRGMPLSDLLQLDPFTVPYDLDNYRSEEEPRPPHSSDYQMAMWEIVCGAMKRIQLIPAREETPAKTDAFNEARKRIESAKVLYYIGFGYHANNIKRLGIKSLKKPQKIMGTTLGLGKTERDYLRDDLHKDNFLEHTFPPVESAKFLHEYVNFNSLSW
jgi:hypothetical protein